MNENDKKKRRKKYEDEPTKEAFFSDMGAIEEEIASEAIELVRHALSLVDTKFYDDAIEILRQAIGLYDQINKLEEINVLKRKIDDVYILKENSFRERELETTNETELTLEEELLTKNLDESYKEADLLIVKATELVKNREFERALDLYDDAIKILISFKMNSEVEKIYGLIEDCYNRKAEFLREQKIPTSKETTTLQQESEGELSDLELKALRIRAFEEIKRIENEKSTEAYEKIGKATELKNVRQYDESLKLFEESILLFEEINWTNEISKIKSIIEEVEREKERFLIELQESKEKEQQELINEKQQEAQLIERANVEKLIRQQNKVEKLREQVIKKQEEIEFENEISDMINYAENLAREYDVSMKKGVKKGKLVENCIYPAVIKIYEQVKEKVKEKGWKNQVIIYENQIKFYKNLLEKDKKLREIESQKLQKQKNFEESLKIKEETTTTVGREDQLNQLKEQKNKEIEIRKFKENIEKSLKEAEKMAREYDSTFKKAVKAGDLNFDSKYPEIIKIFTEARDSLLEKGWTEEAKIYSTHIRKYTELFDKEKRIREIETKKHEEEKVYKDFKKIKKDRFDMEKLKQVEAQKIKENEEKQFQEEIDILIDKAEKLARDYDVALKKALKEGKLIEESPFSEIIEIYSRIKDRFISKGWNDQVSIYTNQIKIYQEKWEKDKRLRELEREKIQKQKIYEDSLKIKGEREISHEKVQDYESKQQKQLEDQIFQEKIAELVNKAEKLAREYELAMKKALKEGKFMEESPYLEVIEIYKEIRKLILEKGWTEQGLIYTNQIKVYQEKLEKDKILREIEHKKTLEQEAFVQAQKVLKTEESIGVDFEKLKQIEELSKQDEAEEKFEREIDKEVDYAEKIAREYELAIKKGEFERKCPYLEIVDIYKKIREKVYARGWKDEAQIYGNQIRLYQEKNEKDERLRELEAEKIKKQLEFEASLKTSKESKTPSYQDLEPISKKDREIEDITKQAMNLIDDAESAVRSYELSLKKDILGIKSPYEQAILNYENAKKLFQKIGWNEEAHRLTNTINFYKDKKIKDDNLRELEKQKQEESKQKVIIVPKKEGFAKEERIVDFEKLKATKSKESEEILNSIDHAERLAQEYDIKKKDGILNIESPFEEIIKIYKKAKSDFKRIGWTNQANQLENTIIYYKDKANTDERLRILEAEKIAKEEEQRKKQRIEAKLAKKAEEELLRLKAQELETKKKIVMEYKSKESEEILSRIDRAEKLAQEYEIKKKDGILKVDSPFEEIIKIYEKAKLDFKRIGWTSQAYQLENTIHYYKDKAKTDENLRTLEAKRIAKEEEQRKKQRIEAELAKKAEEELLRLKAHELELKRKSAREYESKKEQAFNFMDLAKRELKQNNFEKAVSYYKESEKIFAEIKWPEGIRMVNESINVIKLKKDRIERDARLIEEKKIEKLKLEAKIQEQISKAKDIQELQQEQRRKELLAIQEEKEKEREISEKAYRFLEEGTILKDNKKFEEAYDKYMMGRDLFKKLEWEHEVSRINNDLLVILKKEMKQTQKLKAIQQKKIEEKKELEELLKEADEKQKELEVIRKEEKRKQREKIIQKEREIANDIINMLRYNEGVLALKKIIKKIENTDLDDLSRDMKKQIEFLENTSQVPIITKIDIDRDENIDKFKLAYQALDNAQISLSNNVFMRAITEFKEALFNLKQTKIGKKFVPILEEKINFYKKELDIKETPEKKISAPKVESDDLRTKIAARRAERRRKIKKLMGDDDNEDEDRDDL